MRIKESLLAVMVATALIGLGLTRMVSAQSQRAYRYNDNYMRQLFRQLETRTDRFSNLLPNALDRSRIDGTRREDNVNKLVTEFEYETDQLKERFEARQSTAKDAQMVLQKGALINTFMNNRRLDRQTERAWTMVRNDLNRLANAYSVASNWATMQWPTSGTVISGYDAMLTGTYRLNSSLSNNPRSVVNNATRSLPYSERQRISNNLVNRLTPPQTIALERRGNSVTLASTTSPRLNLDVDGIERTETYPNGRVSRVRATFYGDRLTVVSNGDRANDFTVTFAPVNNGRRLLVTRQIYAERLSRPVLVQSYYDRTSEVAHWNLHNPNGNYPNTGTMRGNFLVPNGTQLIAVLNENLSTQSTRDNDRFTMTVREPYLYRNAIIEGHVTSIDRGGRISGRSEMTLNFDRIRLANGSSYNFAGIVQNVRGTNNEDVRVDNEGAIQEENRTNATVQRTAIGTAIGALIGAIAGGGKGAAIGAAVGAGAGAGSIYVQGRDDLSLARGTEITVRASAP
jgi:YMGG-like Gly-zipper